MSHPSQTIRDVIRSMYWTARKDRSSLPHLLGVIGRLPLNYLRLRRLIRASRGDVTFIVRVEHIGDLVAAEPVARRIARDLPGQRIVWVVNRPYADLVAAFPAFGSVFTVRCLTDWIWLSHLVKPPSVLNLHIDGHVCNKCQVEIKGNGHTGINLANFYIGNNLTTLYGRLAGLPDVNDPPIIPPNAAAAERLKGLALPRHYIAVHCKSNERTKDWTADAWGALVDQIIRRFHVAIVEVGLEPTAIPRPGQHRISLCGRLSIVETAEVLRGALLFIGIDSGPTHLANAVSTPGVVLLGRYRDFDHYMPFGGGYGSGETADIIRTDAATARITVDEVMAAVAHRMEAMR